MKPVLTVLFTLLVMTGCERVYEGELQERQGGYYLPNETERFTGVNRLYYENGQLRLEYTFKDGKPEGLVRWWYENGQLRSENTFMYGKKEGLEREYYENGRPSVYAGLRCYSNGELVDMSNCKS
mgnify:CR=1 FL=1